MSATTATTALAAGVESHEEVSGPENGAQRCIRREGSTWSACRCSDCRASNARLHKLNRVGRLGNAAGARARADVLLDSWQAADWNAMAIASATGISVATVRDLLRERRGGHRRELTRGTIQAVLSAATPTSGRVGAVGTRRRLRALAWMGWTLQDLASRTGVPLMTLSDARADSLRTVLAAVATTVADLYEQLQNTMGPSAWIVSYARNRAWAPPAAWDDDTIDDPAAQPEGLVPRGRRTTDPLVVEEVADLHRVGYTDREIATRLGFNTPDAVAMIRRRHLKRAAA